MTTMAETMRGSIHEGCAACIEEMQKTIDLQGQVIARLEELLARAEASMAELAALRKAPRK